MAGDGWQLALLDKRTRKTLESLEQISTPAGNLVFADILGGWTLVDCATNTLFEGFVEGTDQQTAHQRTNQSQQ